MSVSVLQIYYHPFKNQFKILPYSHIKTLGGFWHSLCNSSILSSGNLLIILHPLKGFSTCLIVLLFAVNLAIALGVSKLHMVTYRLLVKPSNVFFSVFILLDLSFSHLSLMIIPAFLKCSIFLVSMSSSVPYSEWHYYLTSF